MSTSTQRMVSAALMILAPLVALIVLFATFFRVKAITTYWVEPVQTVLNLIVVLVCLKALFPWPAVLAAQVMVARLRRASRFAFVALLLLVTLLVLHSLSSVRNELVVAALSISTLGAAFLALATRVRASYLSAAQHA